MPPPEPPLLSQETESAVAESFAELSEALSEHAMRVAEQMAREMVRPMLKQWLDENLPAMVERLVRVEIERIARGKR
jgi:cell pole-organizing protein PopZ